MTHKVTLSFRQCRDLKRVPSIITAFTELQLLTFGRMTALETFDVPVKVFKRLIVLKIGHESLRSRDIPIVLKELSPTVFYLMLSDNFITSIPPWISPSWSRLTVLMLDNNSISSIPPELYELTSLSDLNLQDNDITSVDKDVGKLQSLTALDLSGNKLTTVPTEITTLKRLVFLNLDSNDITEWNVDESADLKIQLANNPICGEANDAEYCVKDCNALCDDREYKRFYCSFNCNTSTCGYHDGKCLEPYMYNQHNPLKKVYN